MFYLIGGSYVSYTGQGSALVDVGSTYVYSRHDGAEYIFDKNIFGSSRAFLGTLVKAKYPTGYEVKYLYKANELMSVINNRGLQIKFTYNSPPGPVGALWRLSKVTAINNSVEFCELLADVCALGQNWPEAALTFGSIPSMPEHEGSLSTITMVDSAGLSTRFTTDGYGQLVRVKERSSLFDNLVYSYCKYDYPYNCYILVAGLSPLSTVVSGLLVAATNAGRQWAYDFHSSPNTGNYFATATSNGPLGSYQVLTRINGRPGPLLNVRDDKGNTAQFEESDRNFPISSSDSLGRYFNYSYDARGNMIEKLQGALSGSGLANIAQSAFYDASCTNIRICNKPIWVRDGLGNQTDYSYDPIHGGLLWVTSPPDAAGGVRPQRRNTYAQRFAWVKNTSGGYVRSTTPVWTISQSSYCRTGAPSISNIGCALGAADEVLTTYDYGPDAGPNGKRLSDAPPKLVKRTDAGGVR